MPKAACTKWMIRKCTMQVFSTIPVLFNYWAKPADGYETIRFFNDHIAETVSKDPKRFIGIGTVPLQDVDLAIKEMERCVKELRHARPGDRHQYQWTEPG